MINDYIQREDLNTHFKVQIVGQFNLEKIDHLFIYKFETLYPIGLNKNNLFRLASCDLALLDLHSSFRFQ